MNIPEQLISRAQAQCQDQNPLTKYKHLPCMRDVHDDWSVSGTGQFSHQEDLAWLQNASPAEIAGELVEASDGWETMAEVSELLVHGEVAKASEVVRQFEPHSDDINAISFFFGPEITEALLASDNK